MPPRKPRHSGTRRTWNHRLILRYIYATTGLIVAITGLLALFLH